jgi:hypothetical protein
VAIRRRAQTLFRGTLVHYGEALPADSAKILVAPTRSGMGMHPSATHKASGIYMSRSEPRALQYWRMPALTCAAQR